MRDIIENKEIKVNEKNIIPLAEIKEESDITLNLELYKNNMPFDVTGQSIKLGLLINNELIGEQSDGITVNKNVVTIKLKNSFIQPGKLELDLTLTDNTGRMTTSSFYLIVNKKTIGGTSIQGTDLLETLDKVILYFKVNSQKAIDGFIAESTQLLSDIKKNGEKTINDIKSNYDSLKQIIIDENQAANLQEQINKNNESISKLNETSKLHEVSINEQKNNIQVINADISEIKNTTKTLTESNELQQTEISSLNENKADKIEVLNKDGSVEMTGNLIPSIPLELGSVEKPWKDINLTGALSGEIGYTKLPNKKILQYGTVWCNYDWTIVTLPTSFKDTNYAIIASYVYGDSKYGTVATQKNGIGKINLSFKSEARPGDSGYVFWIVIGDVGGGE